MILGNFGNQIDGKNVHVGRGGGTDSDESDEESSLLKHDKSDSHPEVCLSMTPPIAPKPTNDKNYYYLPLENVKPNVFIKFPTEEHRRRLYNRNILHRIVQKLVCISCQILFFFITYMLELPDLLANIHVGSKKR